MRTITLSGQDFIVNPLKGKDIKALKAQGFDLMGGGYSISEGMDAVFTVAGFDAAQTDELPFPDILALHKLNVFHWHLSEDQGWRIEIKRYPRLKKKTSGGLGVAFR